MLSFPFFCAVTHMQPLPYACVVLLTTASVLAFLCQPEPYFSSPIDFYAPASGFASSSDEASTLLADAGKGGDSGGCWGGW
ncbi:hypothetical protein T492DRAFT_860184 [Pavlovales sp. CCMP2436]|nr:hypothetical protein T492DRAFT_860184 [Pavlovales sp. CCMP2436]